MSDTGPKPTPRSELTLAVTRGRLYIASYAPLFLILAIRFDGVGLRVTCGAVCVLGTLDALHILFISKRGLLPYPITVHSVDDAGGEVSGYLASYLLPFVTVASPTLRDLLGYGIFLLVALIIYVRSDLVRINPLFYCFGYRVLRIEYGRREHQFLLTRVEPRPEEAVEVVDVAGVLMSRAR
jgi:hypothetical protein